MSGTSGGTSGGGRAGAGFASRRAVPYTAALETLAATAPQVPGEAR